MVVANHHSTAGVELGTWVTGWCLIGHWQKNRHERWALYVDHRRVCCHEFLSWECWLLWTYFMEVLVAMNVFHGSVRCHELLLWECWLPWIVPFRQIESKSQLPMFNQKAILRTATPFFVFFNTWFFYIYTFLNPPFLIIVYIINIYIKKFENFIFNSCPPCIVHVRTLATWTMHVFYKVLCHLSLFFIFLFLFF